MSNIYLISPPNIGSDFVKKLDDLLKTGLVSVFQLRLKDVSDDVVISAAKPLLQLCHDRGVQFILNDNPLIAKQINADGVHIGSDDASYDEARKILGKNKIIGVSCYDSIDRAMALAESGADYVSFGAFFPTTTKQAKTTASIELLEKWSKMSVVTCVAIGGINNQNAPILSKAGADFVAVISYIWNAKDPVLNLKTLAELPSS